MTWETDSETSFSVQEIYEKCPRDQPERGTQKTGKGTGKNGAVMKSKTPSLTPWGLWNYSDFSELSPVELRWPVLFVPASLSQDVCHPEKEDDPQCSALCN